MKRLILFVLILTLALTIPAAAQSDTNDLETRVTRLEQAVKTLRLKLGERTGTPAETSGPSSGPEIHRMNEVVPTANGEFTLKRATVESGILRIVFSARNTTGASVEISTADFSVENSEGIRLLPEAACTGPFRGTVFPSEELSGNLCFGFSGDAPLRVTYELSDAVVWELTK